MLNAMFQGGSFDGVSLGAPVTVQWSIEPSGQWFVVESGDGFRETTTGHGRESLDKYLATLVKP